MRDASPLLAAGSHGRAFAAHNRSIVLIEELEHAKARGAKIYGELTGYGTARLPVERPRPSLLFP